MIEGEGEIDIAGEEGNSSGERVLKSDKLITDNEPISEEARQRIAILNAALAGKYDGSPNNVVEVHATGETTPGPPDPEDLVLLSDDSNVQEELLRWVAEKLEIPTIEDVEGAPRIILKPDHDETQKMEVFAKRFAKESKYFIVRFLEKDDRGEFGNPLYVVWPEFMIQDRLEDFRHFKDSEDESLSNK